MKTCSHCDGKGRISRAKQSTLGRYSWTDTEVCPICDGKGRVRDCVVVDRTNLAEALLLGEYVKAKEECPKCGHMNPKNTFECRECSARLPS